MKTLRHGHLRDFCICMGVQIRVYFQTITEKIPAHSQRGALFMSWVLLSRTALTNPALADACLPAAG